MITHRARDIHKCLKGIGGFTNSQAKVVNWDSDHLEWITIQIIPNEGPYCGGKYDFKIIFGKSYPKHPPQVDCLTPIYHPNIDMTGEDYNVCLSLFDEWQSSFGLEDVIQGLLFLLYYPNLDDPLSPWFDPCMNEEEFKENLQKTLRGELIEDAVNFEFPKMIDSDTKAETEEDSFCLPLLFEEATGDSEEVKEGKDVCNENATVNESLVISPAESQTVNTDHHTADFDKGTERTEKSDATDCGTLNVCDKQEEQGKLQGEAAEDTSDSNNSQAASNDPDEIADYIEDTFLTGFGELLAIDILDKASDDSSEYDDDDDYHSDCLSYTNPLREDELDAQSSGLSAGIDTSHLKALFIRKFWAGITLLLDTGITMYYDPGVIYVDSSSIANRPVIGESMVRERSQLNSIFGSESDDASVSMLDTDLPDPPSIEHSISGKECSCSDSECLTSESDEDSGNVLVETTQNVFRLHSLRVLSFNVLEKTFDCDSDVIPAIRQSLMCDIPEMSYSESEFSQENDLDNDLPSKEASFEENLYFKLSRFLPGVNQTQLNNSDLHKKMMYYRDKRNFFVGYTGFFLLMNFTIGHAKFACPVLSCIQSIFCT